MEVNYEIGELCYRCGITKEEFRRIKYGCEAWGESFKSHWWNAEPVTCDVYEIKVKSSLLE